MHTGRACAYHKHLLSDVLAPRLERGGMHSGALILVLQNFVSPSAKSRESTYLARNLRNVRYASCQTDSDDDMAGVQHALLPVPHNGDGPTFCGIVPFRT